jgi:hypothetical protein
MPKLSKMGECSFIFLDHILTVGASHTHIIGNLPGYFLVIDMDLLERGTKNIA